MKQRYNIGDVVKFEGFPASEVVGIDWYQLRSLSGSEKKWPSYTLVSDNKGPFARWWITDEKHGLYYWVDVGEEDVKGELNFDDSGLCTLGAEGDSIVSSCYSSVAVFQDKDDLYCIEAFEKENLIMKGEKLSPA